MNPVRLRYQRALDGLQHVITSFPDRCWDRRSPCSAWTARMLAGHVIDGQRRPGRHPPLARLMVTWHDARGSAPDLSAQVQTRFEETGLAFLATLRADGSPRIAGIEPTFALGDLWLGMMPGSRKAADATRDPRFALHAATVDKHLTQPHARISGRLVPATADARDRYHDHQRAQGEWVAADAYGDYPLFTADITELALFAATDDAMVIRWWNPASGEQRRERR